jgi:hypothetical protein
MVRRQPAGVGLVSGAFRTYVRLVRVLRSADRPWRLEQTERTGIRVYSGGHGRWFLRFECRTPGELAAWLQQQGDPVASGSRTSGG